MYLALRAEKYRLERWKNDVSGQYLRYDDPSGQIDKVAIAVRDIQLVELVFPEPQLATVCAIVQPYGSTQFLQKWIFRLKSLLGLDSIPQNVPDARRIGNLNIEVIGIGIKPDGLNWVGGERL